MMLEKKASLGVVQNQNDDFEIASKLKSIGQRLLANWSEGHCEINIVPLPVFGTDSQNLTAIQESGNSAKVSGSGFGERFAEIKLYSKHDSKANEKPITIPVQVANNEIKVPTTFAFAGEELIFSPDNVKKAIEVFKKHVENGGSDPNSAYEGLDDPVSAATDAGDFDRTLRIRDEAFAMNMKVASETPLTENMVTLMKEAASLKRLSREDMEKRFKDAEKACAERIRLEKEAAEKSQAPLILEIGDFALQTHQAIELFKKQGLRNASDFSHNASITVIARDGQGDMKFKPGRVFKAPKSIVRTSDHKTTLGATGTNIVVTSESDYKVLSTGQTYKVMPAAEEVTLPFATLSDMMDGKEHVTLLIKENETYGPFIVSEVVFNEGRILTGNTLMERHNGLTPQKANVMRLRNTAFSKDSETIQILLKPGAKLMETISIAEGVDHVFSTLKNQGGKDEDFPSRYDIFDWNTSESGNVYLADPETVVVELKSYLPGHLRNFEDIFMPSPDVEKTAAELILKAASGGQVKVEKPAPDIETYNVAIRVGASQMIKKGLPKGEAIKLLLAAGVPSQDAGALIGIVNSGVRESSRDLDNLVIPEDSASPIDAAKGALAKLVQGDVANQAFTSIIAQQLGDIVTSAGPEVMNGVSGIAGAFGKMASIDLRLSGHFEKLARDHQSGTCLKIAAALRAASDIDTAFGRAAQGDAFDFEAVEKAACAALPELHDIGSELLKLARQAEQDRDVDFDRDLVMHAAEAVDRLIKVASRAYYVE